MPCVQCCADDPLDVVGRAAARLAALHVDDGAERALERAAAAGVEARVIARGAPDASARQIGHAACLERRQVVEVIVERLERARGGVAQHAVEPPLGLAGEQRDPEVEGLLKVGVHLRQHGEAAGDMEPADDDRDAGGAQRPGDVERARELVRLHADQADHAERRHCRDSRG